MVFLHLFIVNKSGGLIHHRPLSSRAPILGTNEWLRIGSTFHSLHAIAAEASPVRLPNGKNSCTCVSIYNHHSFRSLPADASSGICICTSNYRFWSDDVCRQLKRLFSGFTCRSRDSIGQNECPFSLNCICSMIILVTL
jgi:Sybindin-like family